jgi:hypothetical protein
MASFTSDRPTVQEVCQSALIAALLLLRTPWTVSHSDLLRLLSPFLSNGDHEFMQVLKDVPQSL